MTKLLVLGHTPLPTEPQRLQNAGNLRTWHLVKPLLDQGHEVRLVGARSQDSYPEGTDPQLERTEANLHYFSVEPELFHDSSYLQEHHDEQQPDAVLGINTYPASRAVTIETDRPVWCDLNGWVMAEAQTKAATYGDDRYLSHFWNMEQAVLDRADVISTVSRAQQLATVGELATRGRLNRATVGYQFTHHIPNALSEGNYDHRFEVIRGKLVPPDAFVVLWVGGYNTWTDVDLLYRALETTMTQVEDIHFVSTGGAVKGHDDLTFQRFVDLLETSSISDRVHFVGWVPTEHVPSYYHEADLGINVDNRNYETLFGARNRLNDMLKVGLPILTTLGTEISLDLAASELALTVEIGDSDGFAERILWAHTNREQLQAKGRAAADFGAREYSYSRTTEPLVYWARRPQRAPDLGRRVHFDSGIDFFARSDRREPKPKLDATALASRCSELEAELSSIHSSKMWSLWMAYLKLRSLIPGLGNRS